MPPQQLHSPHMAVAVPRRVAGFGNPLLPQLIGLFIVALAANAFFIAYRAGQRNGQEWLQACLLGLGAALFVLVAFGGIAWLFVRWLDQQAAPKIPPPAAVQPPRDDTR